MSETDQLLAAAEAELAALQSQALQQPEPSYGLKQGLYDVGVGTAKSFAGLLDLASLPFVYGANKLGLPTEYGPFTSELKKEIAASTPALQTLGIQPETDVQEYVQYVTPMGVGNVATKGAALKALLKEAALGTTAYAGGQVGKETIGGPYGELIGALSAPAAILGGKALATKALSPLAPAIENAGLGLQRKALGTRKSDYTPAKNAIIETIEGDPTTQLKESMNTLIKDGTLGKSVNPEQVYPRLQAAKEITENSIQNVLKTTEQTIGPVPAPKFEKTLDYISKNIAADQVDNYLNQVIEFTDALKREGKGSLVYLNQQKKIIGENWKNSPQSDPGFWRAFYRDIKSHIEQYAPEVKDLNKRKQDLIVVSPVIERGVKAAGAAEDLGRIQQLLNTTGGAGLVGGSILGEVTGAGIGAGVTGALMLRALSSPKGQGVLGRGLTKLGESVKTPVKSEKLAGTARLLNEEEFAAAQPFVHGTTAAGVKAIEGYGGFIPKTIRYSVLGRGTIYGARRNSWWYDPQKTSKGNMWDVSQVQVPIYLKPEAKVVNISNYADFNKFAKRLGMNAEELADKFFYDPPLTKSLEKESKQLQQKLLDAGVDAINITPTAASQMQSEIAYVIEKGRDAFLDKYAKTFGKDIRETQGIAQKIFDKLKKTNDKFKFIQDRFTAEQIAIFNPKIAEPASIAYKRLLKENPEALMKITPEEFSILPKELKTQIAKFVQGKPGSILAKTLGATGGEIATEQNAMPESTAALPTGDVDTALLEAEQELQRLLESSNQSAANIPTGAKYAPKELVKAVMQVESGGNQAAVSPKGARGMMQLMPPTAKELGVNPNNPKENLEGGSRYLQQNISRFGDTKLGVAAYNMGPNALAKALDKSGAESWEELLAADKRGKIDLPEETKNYVKKVMNLMER